MADTFDVHSICVTLPGTLGDGIPTPLFRVPTKGGCITVLEAHFSVATAITAGTGVLMYGTAVAAGTLVPVATIGTTFGTGGGEYDAMCLHAISVDSAVVPAGNWVGFRIGTMAAAGQNKVYVSYVHGR